MLHNGRSEWLQTKASPAFTTLTIPLFLSIKRRKPIHADPETETTLKDLDKLLKTSPNLTEPRYPEVEAHATDRNRLHLLRHTSSPESQHGAKVLEQVHGCTSSDPQMDPAEKRDPGGDYAEPDQG